MHVSPPSDINFGDLENDLDNLEEFKHYQFSEIPKKHSLLNQKLTQELEERLEVLQNEQLLDESKFINDKELLSDSPKIISILESAEDMKTSLTSLQTSSSKNDENQKIEKSTICNETSKKDDKVAALAQDRDEGILIGNFETGLMSEHLKETSEESYVKVDIEKVPRDNIYDNSDEHESMIKESGKMIHNTIKSNSAHDESESVEQEIIANEPHVHDKVFEKFITDEARETKNTEKITSNEKRITSKIVADNLESNEQEAIPNKDIKSPFTLKETNTSNKSNLDNSQVCEVKESKTTCDGSKELIRKTEKEVSNVKLRPSRDVISQPDKKELYEKELHKVSPDMSASPASTPGKRSRKASKDKEDHPISRDSNRSTPIRVRRRPSRDVSLSVSQTDRLNSLQLTKSDRKSTLDLWPDMICLSKDEEVESDENKSDCQPITAKLELPMKFPTTQQNTTIDSTERSGDKQTKLVKSRSCENTDTTPLETKTVTWILDLENAQLPYIAPKQKINNKEEIPNHTSNSIAQSTTQVLLQGHKEQPAGKNSSVEATSPTSDTLENLTIQTPWGPMKKSPSKSSLKNIENSTIININDCFINITKTKNERTCAGEQLDIKLSPSINANIRSSGSKIERSSSERRKRLIEKYKQVDDIYSSSQPSSANNEVCQSCESEENIYNHPYSLTPSESIGKYSIATPNNIKINNSRTNLPEGLNSTNSLTKESVKVRRRKTLEDNLQSDISHENPCHPWYTGLAGELNKIEKTSNTNTTSIDNDILKHSKNSKETKDKVYNPQVPLNTPNKRLEESHKNESVKDHSKSIPVFSSKKSTDYKCRSKAEQKKYPIPIQIKQEISQEKKSNQHQDDKEEGNNNFKLVIPVKSKMDSNEPLSIKPEGCRSRDSQNLCLSNFSNTQEVEEPQVCKEKENFIKNFSLTKSECGSKINSVIPDNPLSPAETHPFNIKSTNLDKKYPQDSKLNAEISGDLGPIMKSKLESEQKITNKLLINDSIERKRRQRHSLHMPTNEIEIYPDRFATTESIQIQRPCNNTHPENLKEKSELKQSIGELDSQCIPIHSLRVSPHSIKPFTGPQQTSFQNDIDLQDNSDKEPKRLIVKDPSPCSRKNSSSPLNSMSDFAQTSPLNSNTGKSSHHVVNKPETVLNTSISKKDKLSSPSAGKKPRGLMLVSAHDRIMQFEKKRDEPQEKPAQKPISRTKTNTSYVDSQSQLELQSKVNISPLGDRNNIPTVVCSKSNFSNIAFMRNRLMHKASSITSLSQNIPDTLDFHNNLERAKSTHYLPAS